MVRTCWPLNGVVVGVKDDCVGIVKRFVGLPRCDSVLGDVIAALGPVDSHAINVIRNCITIHVFMRLCTVVRHALHTLLKRVGYRLATKQCAVPPWIADVEVPVGLANQSYRLALQPVGTARMSVRAKPSPLRGEAGRWPWRGRTRSSRHSSRRLDAVPCHRCGRRLVRHLLGRNRCRQAGAHAPRSSFLRL
jgi:hypothetical protein